jgi:DNA-binding HxlR family transcriptional regulator
MLGNDYIRQDCSIARALEVVGERWTLLIVRDALYGVRRFSDFQSHLDIPKAVLSERLTGLVEQGILERRADPDHRGRYLYELTAAGRDLWPVVHSLFSWTEQHRAPSDRRFRHTRCGTELDHTAACPSCGITPPVEDVTMELRRARKGSRTDPVALALAKPHRMLEPLDTAAPSVPAPGAKRS